MKTINTLLTFILFSSCISTSGESKMEADKYVDMTIEQVIEKLGSPNFRSEQIIDDKYLPTPIEPIYSAYFTNEALQKTVIINVARWVKGKTNIIVWLKNVEGDWVVFSSLKYSKSPNMQI
jgi:hypothetical protein